MNQRESTTHENLKYIQELAHDGRHTQDTRTSTRNKEQPANSRGTKRNHQRTGQRSPHTQTTRPNLGTSSGNRNFCWKQRLFFLRTVSFVLRSSYFFTSFFKTATSFFTLEQYSFLSQKAKKRYRGRFSKAFIPDAPCSTNAVGRSVCPVRCIFVLLRTMPSLLSGDDANRSVLILQCREHFSF